MKKIISHIFPITKKIHSEHNGILELTWHNGKKVLDTENANYSYGSLQRILEFGLDKIDFKGINSTLILGLGGGSVIDSLITKFKYKGIITSVEFDKKVIEIAADEFNIIANEELEIIHDDALKYVENTKQRFDLIIVDLFIDNGVPPQFLTKSFCEKLLKRMTQSSSILYNIGIHTTPDQIKEVVAYFLSTGGIKLSTFSKVENTNTILIIEKQ